MLKHWTRFFASLAAGLGTYHPAGAEGSSLHITVNVPPIAEALSAADTGAAGAWTIASGDGGLLISTERTPVDAIAGVSVFRSDRNRFQLHSIDQPGAPALMPDTVEPGRSLVRFRFDLNTGPGQNVNREVRILLSAT
ncbi:MAG: hypothetical protein ACK4MQ_10625 [Hyphomonas sp.]